MMLDLIVFGALAVTLLACMFYLIAEDARRYRFDDDEEEEDGDDDQS